MAGEAPKLRTFAQGYEAGKAGTRLSIPDFEHTPQAALDGLKRGLEEYRLEHTPKR